MILLTLLTYGIYREVRNENYDPEVDETVTNWVIHGVILCFFWPFFVIPLGAKLVTSRQRKAWYSSFGLLAFISLLAGLGAYFVIGISIVMLKVFGYLYYAYRIQQQKERAQAAETDYESWE